jgi:HAD superfamily hydrolase (TIGR01484 family)
MSLSHCSFVLATDLDGTFLGGPKRARRRLYSWIEENRATTGLIYVTGRPAVFITELVETSHPRPDLAICDVGTSLYRISADGTAMPDAVLEAPIAETWKNRGPEVRQALSGHPGLTEQPYMSRHRVNFDMDPARLEARSLETVQALGLDTLISDNRFFDVLPRGVSKGPSLLRALKALNTKAQVLTAGDTLNDLSMLTCGLPAVAVANSEPALLEALPAHPDLHIATRKGAAGILEAMARMGIGPDA